MAPSGWDDWMACMQKGSSPWEAAGLPLKFGSRQPDKYPDLRPYHGDVGAVAWASFYKHFKEQATINGWSPLQMGVVLYTCLRGQARQVVESQYGHPQRYNVFKLVKALTSWGDKPADVQRDCVTVFRQRKQAVGEDAHAYACELMFLADMAWPETYQTEKRAEELLKRFVEGLHRSVVRAQLLGAYELGQITDLQQAVKVARRLSRAQQDTGANRQEQVGAMAAELSQARRVAYGLELDTPQELSSTYEVNEVDTSYEVKEEDTSCEVNMVRAAGEPRGRPRDSYPPRGGPTDNKGLRPRANRQGESACFNCGSEGHWMKECPEPRKPRSGGEGANRPKTPANPGKK